MGGKGTGPRLHRLAKRDPVLFASAWYVSTLWSQDGLYTQAVLTREWTRLFCGLSGSVVIGPETKTRKFVACLYSVVSRPSE